jgi:hypothetical protein
MFVCFVCCVLSGRGICDELITCLEDSYRLWCVFVYGHGNLVDEEAISPLWAAEPERERERRRP